MDANPRVKNVLKQDGHGTTKTLVSAENAGLKEMLQIVDQEECSLRQWSRTSLHGWFAGTQAGGYKHIRSHITNEYKGLGTLKSEEGMRSLVPELSNEPLLKHRIFKPRVSDRHVTPWQNTIFKRTLETLWDGTQSMKNYSLNPHDVPRLQH